LEDDDLQVFTNLFPLVFKGRVELTIQQFTITIENARRKKADANRPGDSGKAVPALEPAPPRPEESDREINKASSPLSRRILLKCQAILKDEWFFYTDGAKTAYSVDAIPEKYDVSKFEDEDRDAAGVVVEVSDGCDDDDDDAPHVISKKYIVWFEPVGEPFRIVITDGKCDPSCVENMPRLNNFLHQVLNNACMMSKLISTEKNPERYYFPVPASRNLLGRHFQEKNKSHPLLGLSQSVSVAVDGSMQIQSDFSLGWFESALVKKRLLDPQSRTLAGVFVDLERPITDLKKQEEIKAALNMLLLHSRYERGPQWEADEENFLREKYQGKADLDKFIQNRISKMRVAVQLNRRIIKPKTGEIVFFVPNDYTFSFKGEELTVERYFKARYDVTLRYPNMPLIRIRRQDYMPAEFLFYGKYNYHRAQPYN
jgi:hypothetical protein